MSMTQTAQATICGVEAALNAHKTRNKYWVKGYNLPSGKFIDTNIGMTDAEIEEILDMPKVGKRLTFVEAAYMRNGSTCVQRGNDFDFDLSALEVTMAQWAQSKGYYIEFQPDELKIKPGVQ